MLCSQSFTSTGPLVVFLEGNDPSDNSTVRYNRWKRILRDDFGLTVLQQPLSNGQDNLEPIRLVIIVQQCQNVFSSGEHHFLERCRDHGICLFFLTRCEPEQATIQQINDFLLSEGVKFTGKKVLHETWYRNVFPKEPLITDGFSQRSPSYLQDGGTTVVYPSGCTLEIASSSTAIPLLTTGHSCHPFNSTISALIPTGKGKIVCFGSSNSFCDDFIGTHQNEELLLAITKLCLTGSDDDIARLRNQQKPRESSRLLAASICGRGPLRPTPVIKNVFQTLSLDEHLARMISGTGDGDFRKFLRLEMEIERVAEELHVGPHDNGDLSRTLIGSFLQRGSLPDLKFPVFDPVSRSPGEPQLVEFDLDEELLTWEERLQRICANISDSEPGSQKLYSEIMETLDSRKSREGHSVSPMETLQTATKQRLSYDRMTKVYGERNRDAMSDDYPEGSHRNDQFTAASGRHTFRLSSAVNFLTSAAKLSSFEDETDVLKYCLDRRRDVQQARLVLSDHTD